MADIEMTTRPPKRPRPSSSTAVTSPNTTGGNDGGNSEEVKLINERKWFSHQNHFKFTFKDSWDDIFTTTPKAFGALGLFDFMDREYAIQLERASQLFNKVRVTNMVMTIHNITGYTRNFQLANNNESNSTQNTPNGFLCLRPKLRKEQNGLYRIYLNDDPDNALAFRTDRLVTNNNNTPLYLPPFTRRSGDVQTTVPMRGYDVLEVSSFQKEQSQLPIVSNLQQSENKNQIPTVVPQVQGNAWDRTQPHNVYQRDWVTYMDMNKETKIELKYPNTPWMPTGITSNYVTEEPTAAKILPAAGQTLDMEMNPFQFAKRVVDGSPTRMVCHTWPRGGLPCAHFRQAYNTELDKWGKDSQVPIIMLSALNHEDLNAVTIPQFFNCTVSMTADYEFSMNTDLQDTAWGESTPLETAKEEGMFVPPVELRRAAIDDLAAMYFEGLAF